MDIDLQIRDQLNHERYLQWGIRPTPYIFVTNLKILLVLDGGIDTSATGFGVGKLLEILAEPVAWWVAFDVHVAVRDAASRPPVSYVNFRFDQPGFDLAEYDQVWLFGFQPGTEDGPDEDVYAESKHPLSDSELAVLTNWMNAGGGVFATGDHHYLGASMCSRVPRVRTMRKWTNAQGVPPRDSARRLDTNQPATNAQRRNAELMPFELQGDGIPQPVEVVPQLAFELAPLYRVYQAHPILCSTSGVIDVLPDHPHEGQVIDDDEVQLDHPLLDLDGFSDKPEYPGGRNRPTPSVIAYGRTTHQYRNREKGPVDPERFGLIGVYDGERVDEGDPVGRVVVDSTWHHWLSENIVGFESSNPRVFELLKSYYRNVALWLATPRQRSSMLAGATWGVVTGRGPMEFPPSAEVFQLGGHVRDVLGRTASQCLVEVWIRDNLDEEMFGVRLPDGCLACPPWRVFEEAILGGMASEMAALTLSMQEAASGGQRAIIVPRQIAHAAAVGVERGRRHLAAQLAADADAVRELAAAVGSASKEPDFPEPDLGLTTIAIRVLQVQVTDPFDPALLTEQIDMRWSLVVDGHVLSSGQSVIEGEPRFEPHGWIVETGIDFGDVTVWHGTTVSVVATAGEADPRIPGDAFRGRVDLRGDPSTWLGEHRPPANSDSRWRPLIVVSR